MFESKAGVFAIAGLAFFALAFLVMGLLPWLMYVDDPELTLEQVIERDGISPDFVDLAERYPAEFHEYYGEATAVSYAEAIRLGHHLYVGEACWHCHSQQVRPVSKENQRWGPASNAWEYQNEMQRPVLFGTRRVGPDLSREAARRTNDWHAAHFYRPTSVVPTSVMPEYPWFFDENRIPNKRGMALITYMQWLGTWLDVYPYYLEEGPPGTQPVVPENLRGEASTTADAGSADHADGSRS